MAGDVVMVMDGEQNYSAEMRMIDSRARQRHARVEAASWESMDLTHVLNAWSGFIRR